MTRTSIVLGIMASGCGSLLAEVTTGDASRGERFLREQGCMACHKVNGQGGNRAPDLGTRTSRNYTPAALAAVIWNHAPSAWAQAASQAKAGTISAGDTADLFAYFCSRRYFEPLGDAGRGKQVFIGKQCATCHGIRDRVSPDAPPVVAWGSLHDPIGFARDLWNLQPVMALAFDRKGIQHPRLSSWEVNDLLLYLDNLHEIRGREPRFQLASPEMGRAQFHKMQCDSCHQGKLALEQRAERISMADIQAAFWNHAPTKLRTRPAVSYDEMCALVSYLWSLEPRGDPRRGERAFTRKKCAGCHADPGNGTPVLSERDLPPVSVIAALWSHGPAMQAEMNRKSLAWPHISKSEMADMAPYLRTPHPSGLKEVPYSAAGIGTLSRIHDH